MNFFSAFSKSSKSSSSTSNTNNKKNILSKMVDQDAILQEKLEKLEKQKNLRKLNLLEDEKNLKKCEEDTIRQLQKKNNNDKMIQYLVTDKETTHQLLSSIQRDNLQKQEKLLLYLIEVEKSSKELINNTLNLNQSFEMDYYQKCGKCDSIEHTKSDDKLKITKQDEEIALKLEQIFENANNKHCLLVNKESKSELSDMEKLTNLLNTSNCYRQVLKEHLKAMYNQLKYLTSAELQKRNSQLNKQINDLSNDRIQLTQLLVDFINKKEQNQTYLIKNLEAQNFEFETTTKWLLQYSKLVNDAPSELSFSKIPINPTLLHRVCTAGGSHLLLFILENELKLPLTKEYLINMGVNSRKDQEILINSLNHFPTPSAPTENEFSPSAPFLDELECIVCMEEQFDVLFIPCGHLCCCWKCSEKLTSCPMCRTDISKKINVKSIT